MPETAIDTTVIFDESNPNWYRHEEINLLFLRQLKRHFNDLLLTRGHVFLNEIYDAVDVPRTRTGATCGWFREPGSKHVEIFFDSRPNGALRLEFNPDGYIVDKLPERGHDG